MKPKGKMTLDLRCVEDEAKIHLYFSGALQEELWRAILLFLSFPAAIHGVFMPDRV